MAKQWDHQARDVTLARCDGCKEVNWVKHGLCYNCVKELGLKSVW